MDGGRRKLSSPVSQQRCDPASAGLDRTLPLVDVRLPAGKYRCKGRNPLLVLVLFVMIIPMEILILPLYKEVNAFKLIYRGTYRGQRERLRNKERI